MINAYCELQDTLLDYGYDVDDIATVGDFLTFDEYDVQEFLDCLKGIVYDNGYGCVYFRRGIKLIMTDGTWIEREEYDGSEWWTHRSVPAIDALVPHKGSLNKGDVIISYTWDVE